MKLSHIKKILKRMITDRNFQVAVTLFVVGFILVAISTYPFLKEYERENTVERGDDKKIDIKYTSGVIRTPLGGIEALKNATLEFESDEGTKANITMLSEEGTEIRSIEIDGKENEEVNLSSDKYNNIEYLRFEVREGSLSYTYTLLYYERSYSNLSFLGYAMMIISVLPFFRGLTLLNPRDVGKKEREEMKKNEEVLDDILEGRKK